MAGRIYVTGDCHGNFQKFGNKSFPINKELDKDDYVIICGDFGAIWSKDGESLDEQYHLNWLNDRNFTTLFVDGNHENFDRLSQYPLEEWKGGKIHRIRPSVIHLMRGQVYEIAENTIFTFGGAQSHDISGGILDPTDVDYLSKKKELEREWMPFRVKGISWWEEELPSQAEMDEALYNLERYNYKVDYIISHCCCNSIQDKLSPDGLFEEDSETAFFELIHDKCQYKKWYFGHYHADLKVTKQDNVLYYQIVELGCNAMDAVPGRPSYEEDDEVEFTHIVQGELLTFQGRIAHVKPYGSDTQNDEPSYDILVDLNGQTCLIEDVRESDIENGEW